MLSSTPIITSSTGRRFRTLDDELDNDIDSIAEDVNGNNVNRISVNDVNNKRISNHSSNSIIRTNICYDSYGFRVTAREKAAQQMYNVLINGVNCSNSTSNIKSNN